jgi:pimeloyl-ACP methyl ester carboxylesterase
MTRMPVSLCRTLSGLAMAVVLWAAPARADLAFSVVKGAGGVPLTVVQAGNKEGPAILFIHGFTQSYLSWEKQLNDPELQKRFHLIALDLRGHGTSGKPWEPAAYTPQIWAEDIAAVIAATGNRKPVLVPWSMGGSVTMNYLLHRGLNDISGVAFVASAASLAGPMPPPDPKDPKVAAMMQRMGGMQSNDIRKNLESTRAFVASLTAKPLPAAEQEEILVYNMLTPAYVRGAMFGTRPDYSSLKGKIAFPVLIIHGDIDAVVPYQMAVDTKRDIPAATLTTYQGIGHAPFLEDAPRFNRDLAAFVDKTQRR